jgi:ribosomal-protein-alanine N-acetyltransferase
MLQCPQAREINPRADEMDTANGHATKESLHGTADRRAVEEAQVPPLIEVIQMTEEHVPAVEEIERRSFPVCWPANSFLNEVKNNRVAFYLVALIDGTPVGYIGVWFVMDEAHITTVGVLPDQRGKLIAKRLLWALMSKAVERKIRWATLEVAETNRAAIALYRSFGFTQVGLRKGYYNCEENAIVMWAGNLQGETFRRRLDEMGKEWDSTVVLDRLL